MQSEDEEERQNFAFGSPGFKITPPIFNNTTTTTTLLFTLLFIFQEADKAAVLIQSSFRGYQARKKLSRGDAVHMPTTSSSATPSSARSEEPVTISHRGTGEFHDAVFGK